MEMSSGRNLFTRRRFLKLAAVLLSIYPAKHFVDVLDKSRHKPNRNRQITLPFDLPEGLSFHDEIIANRNGETVSFFSATCPHLGCQINRADGNRLVCPCHGSRFSDRGKVLSGPSVSDLTELPFTRDPGSGKFTVQLAN